MKGGDWDVCMDCSKLSNHSHMPCAGADRYVHHHQFGAQQKEGQVLLRLRLPELPYGRFLPQALIRTRETQAPLASPFEMQATFAQTGTGCQQVRRNGCIFPSYRLARAAVRPSGYRRSVHEAAAAGRPEETENNAAYCCCA